jgi:hypothetical protein
MPRCSYCGRFISEYDGDHCMNCAWIDSFQEELKAGSGYKWMQPASAPKRVRTCNAVDEAVFYRRALLRPSVHPPQCSQDPLLLILWDERYWDGLCEKHLIRLSKHVKMKPDFIAAVAGVR